MLGLWLLGSKLGSRKIYVTPGTSVSEEFNTGHEELTKLRLED